MRTIEAALFREIGKPFRVEEVQLEDPGPGEVLVKLQAAGVCHSDWHLVTGATKVPTPMVPGHEGAGIVAAIGPRVSHVRVGDLVALNWAPYCGGCFYCLEGTPALCGEYLPQKWAGTLLDGTTRLWQDDRPVYHFTATACFAEYTVVPECCAVPLPPDVPPAFAAVIGCAVTTGVGAVLNKAQVTAGSSVAVFGCGGVGLCTILGAVAAGASRIIAVDLSPEKLAFAQSLGATEGVLAGEDVVAAVRAATQGRGADYSFECVGIPALQEQAFDATRPGGTLVLAGITPTGTTTSLPGAPWTRQEKTVCGTYYGTCHPRRDFPRYADLWRQGRLPLEKLITRTYTLGHVAGAYNDLVSGAVGRGIITF